MHKIGFHRSHSHSSNEANEANDVKDVNASGTGTTFASINTAARGTKPTPSRDGLSLIYTPSLTHPGSKIDGIVCVDLGVVSQKNVEEVVVELIGVVKTRVMVSTGETVMTFYGKNEFLSQSLSIYRSSDNVPPSSEVVQYPFSFTIPSDHSLPPSHAFQSSSHQAKGSVQYHVKVTGKKAAWYKSNVRLYGPFPFLPFDDGNGVGRREMKGVQTRVLREEMSMRKGLLFGGHAKVLVEVSLPDLPSLPLFTSTPISIRLQTFSKPLPHSSSSDPSSFTFPLPPTSASDIDFILLQKTFVNAKGNTEKRTTEFSGVGGFGKAGKGLETVVRVGDGRGGGEGKPRVTVGEVIWVDEGGGEGKEGRWSQDVSFDSSFELCGSPSFDMGILEMHYMFELKIAFPGVGNTFKMKIDPRRVSSGISSTDLIGKVEIPPAYWDVVDPDDDHEHYDKK
ncbi:hypothetical protein SISSUDRAFT_1048300 [Sistotremastrum suecicum HHB10207 ss-3]|uniref:Arrestin-like N-terminal domain-containing protein n=1 Tax=Sistotremastrum suecicum HHB10207 ss-3 TaxID=1314776 RepID=A0A166CKR3_9AGAM|nr:hypothetical protein SISSUDRAFT_1048300 [Sistotremastrum suecicum HHB10207 ss-3]